MVTGFQYIVTKASNDGTFQIGDHIIALDDGSIICLEAQGWIASEHVPEAWEGVEVKVDKDWLYRKKTELHCQLSKLNDMEGA